MAGIETFFGEFDLTEETRQEEPKEKEASQKSTDRDSSEEEEETSEEESLEENEESTNTSEESDDSGKEDESSKGGEEEEPEESEFSKVASQLAEEGYLDFPEDEEELDDSAEGFSKLLEFNKKKTIEDYRKQLSEKTGGLLDAVEAGMSPEEWYQSQQKVDYSTFDLEDEDQARRVLSDYYKVKGFEKDEIDDMIEALESLGKDGREAEKAQKFLVTKAEKDQEAQQKQIEEARAEQERQNEEIRTQYMKTIDDLDEVSGFKLDKKQKESFKDYLFKVDPKTGKTASQLDDSPERRIKLAMMAYIDANKEKFEKQAESKVTRKLRKTLSNSEAKSKPKGQSVKSTKKSKESLNIPSLWGNDNIETED